MHGSWHRYAGGERWRKPRSQASLVLTTDSDVFVCFNAKELELVSAPSVRARILTSRLGPDLTRPGADIELAVRRARDMLDGDALIADVLLDQRAACGIGNVYKSEVLFIERRLPHTPFADVDDAELRRLYVTASDLLCRNLGGGKRVTRFEADGAGRLWVYGRRGLPCLRCDGRIESRRMGRHHRGTHWCAGCQA
jgi:endonuclease-8